MSSKRVQIFYASIGSGHLSAARSIARSISNLDKRIQVDLHDIFRPNPFNSLFQEIFSFVPSQLLPNTYTYIWKNGTFKWGYDLMVRFSPLRKTILNSIRDYSPDLVICTHTFPCSVVSQWKENQAHLPLMAVATDQYLHPYWTTKNLDAFIAPNEEMKFELLRRGLLVEKIFPYGIPVSIPKIKHDDSQSKRNRYHAIILAGSYRVAPYLVIHPRVRQIIQFLERNHSHNMEWLFVFGAAKGLMNLARTRLGFREDVRIYDFPSNIQELISRADFVFTKPGGLTVAEALAFKKPLILLSSGAGQELENTRFVIQSKAGLLADKRQDLDTLLKKLNSNPAEIIKEFKTMKHPLEKAAEKTARLAIKLLKKNN
jgi:processive 1,2-diacylglycerol beta-glucosyltransferase